MSYYEYLRRRNERRNARRSFPFVTYREKFKRKYGLKIPTLKKHQGGMDFVATDALVSMQEHDDKYHDGHYEEGQRCNLRDTLRREDTKSTSTGNKNRLVTPEEEAEYMNAVESGDDEKAKEIVRTVAGRAFKDSIVRDNEGKMVEVFHGSDMRRNIFEAHDGAFGDGGVYFTSAFPEAADYAREKLGNDDLSEDELEDCITAAYINVTDMGNVSSSNYGYADFKWCDEMQVMHENYQFSVKPGQIKSSDAVTYDDDGKIIPLSHRFDFTNPDIRY